MHSFTYYSPFKIVYGYNPLTPLNLSPLHVNERVNLDGIQKVDFVSNLREKLRQNIERQK